MPDVLDRLKAAFAERYTIEREIGAGGMATVYLAEDLKHHRKGGREGTPPRTRSHAGARALRPRNPGHR